jgi:hypothetical protein
MYLLLRWYVRTANADAGGPDCFRNRTAVADERSGLRRVKLNRFMSLLIFSISVTSLVTIYPSRAASSGDTLQRVPVMTVASKHVGTIYEETDGAIQ